MTVDAVLAALTGWSRVDLSHPLEEGMPGSPNHPCFSLELVRRHGDRVRADGGSAASERMSFAGHTGTHIDALGHVSHDGRLYGGIDAATVQTGRRLSALGVDELPLYFTRGVVLDVAVQGPLPAGQAVTADDLAVAEARAGVAVRPGDAVLVRTGWGVHWADPARFGGQEHGAPGPDAAAGDWLAERRPAVVGGETLAFEHVPAGRGHALLPVHRRLLVEAGIPILESLRLDELVGVTTFVFVLAPLRVVGATGVPVRPFALVPP